jgi:hypothetical protein
MKAPRQDGVALMLSVLVLAAITAIAFSLSTIVFIELRASRDVLRSEPALYATLGVTEEALFKYKRVVDDDDMNLTACTPGDLKLCSINGVTLVPELTSQSDVPHLVTVYPGSSNAVYIPLMEDLTNWTPPFSRVELQLVPLGGGDQSSLDFSYIYYVQGAEPIPQTAYSSTLVESDDEPDLGIDFVAGRQYQLKLLNNSEEIVQVSIWPYSWDDHDETLGLYFITSKVFKVVASHAGLTRVYRVEIPVGDSSLGD